MLWCIESKVTNNSSKTIADRLSLLSVDHMSDSDKSFNRNVRVSAWIDVKKLSPKQMPRMNISEPRAAAWRVVLLV